MKNGHEQTLEPLALATGLNVLSVDVEDWHHLACGDMTRWLLDLFEQKGATATFFIVGTVAERMPDLVREIHARGHEVASHGWRHESLRGITRDQFREDLVKSMHLLNGITEAPVIGFRAPMFSITRDTLWALEVMAAAGIRYDSSVFPFVGTRYGIEGFPRGPVRYRRNGASVIEMPLSTVRALGRTWPVSGGGYFRLMPGWLIRRVVRTVRGEGMPFVAYCHPYEFDRRTLRHAGQHATFSWSGARRDELKTNLFRGSMRRKLTHLLDEFAFSSFREVLRDVI